MEVRTWPGERTRRREGRRKKQKLEELWGREEVGDLFKESQRVARREHRDG